MAGTNTTPDSECPLQILLVEDDPDEQLLFAMATRRAKLNCRVETVDHGEQAIAYLKGAGPYADRNRYPLPDLVVMDLKMPVMDGCELLSWLKGSANFSGLPVVAISGSPEQSLRGKAHALGAGTFLEKPFGMDKWTSMVREIWDFAHGQVFRVTARDDRNPTTPV